MIITKIEKICFSGFAIALLLMVLMLYVGIILEYDLSAQILGFIGMVIVAVSGMSLFIFALPDRLNRRRV